MDIVDINKYTTELNKALEALNMVDLMAEYNKAVNEQLVMAYDDGLAKGGELAKKALEENGESLDSKKTTTIRNEAWDCLKRIVLYPSYGGLSNEELEQLFGTCIYMDILTNKSITGEKVYITIKAYLDEKAKRNVVSPYKTQIIDRINYVVQTAHTLQENYSWSMAQSIIDDLQSLVIDINNDNIEGRVE